MPPTSTLFTRSFALLVLASFLQSLGFASMLTLPVHLTDLGALRAEIGLAMAAGAVGGLLMRPAVGWALDRFGRRPTLVLGTGLAALGLLLLGRVERLGAPTGAGPDLVATLARLGPLLLVGRVCFGVGQGAMFAGYTTITADLVPPERRTEGLALVGTAGLVPLSLIAFLDELHATPGGLWVVYPVAAVAMLSSLAALFALPEPPREPPGPGGPTAGPPWWRVLAAPALLPPWVATVALAGVVSTFMAFAAVVAARRGVAWPTGLWLPYAGTAVLLRLIGSQLLDRVGPRNVVVPALGFYVVAIAVAAAARTSDGFLLAGALGGVGHGAGFPVVVTQVVSRAPASRRGVVVAAFSALWGVSDLLVPPLCGALADRAGDEVMLAAAASTAGLLIALWAVLEHLLGPPAIPPRAGAAGRPAPQASATLAP